MNDIDWRALFHFWLWIAAALSLPAGFVSVYWGLAGGSWPLPLQLFYGVFTAATCFVVGVLAVESVK